MKHDHRRNVKKLAGVATAVKLYGQRWFEIRSIVAKK
jgi:hypothetical protein